MSDVPHAKIFNNVGLPIGMMILVKVGTNLAPGGIVNTLYLAVSNLVLLSAFCILKNLFLGNRWRFIFDIIPFTSIVCSAIML